MINKKTKTIILISTIVLFIFILWVIYLSNIGSKSVFFAIAISVPFGDKIGHVFLYGILALGLSLVLNFKAFHLGKIKIYLGVLLVAIFAFIEEGTQAFYPHRTLDAYDLLANIIGLVLASIFVNKIEKALKEEV